MSNGLNGINFMSNEKFNSLETIDETQIYGVKNSVCSKLEIDEELALKADKETTYTKTEVDDLLDNVSVDTSGLANTSLNNLTTAGDNYIDSRITSIMDSIYPVGSIYISTNLTNPMATLITGSAWELVSSGKALWTGDGTNGGTTINAGLPNITGSISLKDMSQEVSVADGAFTLDTTVGDGDYTGTNNYARKYFKANFSASSSNSIYGNSTTVQPPAYVVNVWRRTA